MSNPSVDRLHRPDNMQILLKLFNGGARRSKPHMLLGRYGHLEKLGFVLLLFIRLCTLLWAGGTAHQCQQKDNGR
jgi:hypothetical protein